MNAPAFDLSTLRHSASHILAQAVKRLYPDVKLAIGPSIDDGFYYDFDLSAPISDDDLGRIAAEMKKIVKENQPFEKSLLPREEALKFFSDRGEIYKVELISELSSGEQISVYRNGDFVDLCRGPHVERTGQVKAFALLSVAGAYWRGDEKNKMLQRVYGTAFATQAELDEYVAKREEARKRDHRKLGKELELFSIHEEAGNGLIFWDPKGTRVRHQIESLLKDLHYRVGYDFVTTPHMARIDLWKISGHIDFYRENMFAPMLTDDVEYIIKPMNCPGHILIYKNQIHSYRDLPYRIAEFGTVYRYERSGVLHGTMRVRGFTQDDAHIFCTPDQIRDEVMGVLDLIYLLMDIFGFEVKVFLSTRPEKYVGTVENWEVATTALEQALKTKNIPFTVDPGEGVFYGPKIDFKMLDVLGRTWQGPTVQVDFNLTERFGVNYIDKDGQQRRCVMIHRALLGSFERFFGVLIEHYGAQFPLWLAPEQVRVVPVGEKTVDYARAVERRLRSAGLRVCVDSTDDKLGKRIRNAENEKIPYVLVVGEQEQTQNKVAVRKKGEGDKGAMEVGAFLDLIAPELTHASAKVDAYLKKIGRI